MEGKKQYIFSLIRGTSAAKMKELIGALEVHDFDLKKSLEVISSLKDNTANTDSKLLNELVLMFLLSLGDVGLNTLGKDSSAVRVGITPHNIKTDKVVNLPGTELFAFGGFTDENTRIYSFAYGRLCAHNILENNQFRQYHEDTTRNLVANPNDKLFQFIDGSTEEVREAKELTIDSLTSQQYFVNHLDNYSNSLFKSGFDKLIARLNTMYSINFWGGLAAGLGLFVGNIANVFTDKVFKWLVKLVAGKGLGINHMKIEKTFQPLKIKIVINDAYGVNLHYTTVSSDRKEKLNFITRNKDKQSIIEFLLFLDTDTLVSNGKLRVLPNASLAFQALDPNFESPKQYGDPLKKLFVTSFFNRFNRGVNHVIDLEALINNKSESIFYSIRALDYHINPMLTLVPHDNEQCDVTFEEGTTAFELEI
jgi:hypothetical protein